MVGALDPVRYPIRGTFAGCCASAKAADAKRTVANTTESIFLLWDFSASYLSSPYGRIKVRVAHSSVTALTLALSQRERELQEQTHQSKFVLCCLWAVASLNSVPQLLGHFRRYSAIGDLFKWYVGVGKPAL